MDQKPVINGVKGPKKMKFLPKAPVRRVPMPIPKSEVLDDAETVQAKELMRRFNEAMDVKPKVEKKRAPVQVAFGYGASSMNHSASKAKAKAGVSGFPEKEYKEPWNYYTNYPVTLPLRRPYSGNPVELDEKEFEQPSANEVFDESRMNPAMELGFLEDNPEPKMMFLQLPLHVPMPKGASATASTSQEIADNKKPPAVPGPGGTSRSLYELSGGHMGKLQVYKSGKMKLKLGETLYDVTPGSNCVFAQDVVAINTKEKHCCVLGELNKRATVTPDVDSILNSMADLA